MINWKNRCRFRLAMKCTLMGQILFLLQRARKWKPCQKTDHDHQDDGGGDDPGDGEEKVTAMMTNDQ